MINRLEGQRAELDEIQLLQPQVGALRPMESVGDRHLHVGITEVRERRTISERNHRVDNRLRVNYDVDRVVSGAE